MRSQTFFRLLIYLGASIVFLSGCSQGETANMQADQSAVAAIWTEYSSSLNAGDIDRWLSLWTTDGIQLPPGEPPVVGIEQIRARNQAILEQMSFDMAIANEEAQVAGAWAYSRGSYTATLTPKAGGDVTLIDGKYMTILKRQIDNSWKIHRDIFNSSAH